MSDFKATFQSNETFNAGLKESNGLNATFGNSAGGSGTRDYEKLINQPSINHRKVIGDKTGADYNLQDKMDAATVAEIEKILYLD